jgi:hypothetical protein
MTQIDPRLAFLARAAARMQLFEIGEMDLNEAFEGLMLEGAAFVDAFEHAHQEATVEAIKDAVRQHGSIALDDPVTKAALLDLAPTARDQVVTWIKNFRIPDGSR